MINFFSRSNYKVDHKIVAKEISFYLKKYGFSKNDFLNVIFVSIRKMREIAKKYKKEDLVLPVLSFSYLNQGKTISQNEGLVGEIFICYPQVILLAAKREKEVDTIIIELIKHGIDNILLK